MEEGQLRLLHQDGQLLIVHKPSGWTIYKEDGVPKSQHLQPICEEMFDGKFYPVHRLDRATCGIVVFATEGRWAREMQELFSKREVQKTYRALLWGATKKSQKIDIPLKEKDGRLQSAVTLLSLKKTGVLENHPVSLVDLNPETGRFHQLRKHCKLIEHPIVGDKIYGSQKDVRRLMLSATGLRFIHPRNKKRIVISDTPDPSFLSVADDALASN